MRQLASIQRIKRIEPIDGADAIVKATISGWQLVVKMNEFKEGELCVYIEIDSILPERPEFEFLRLRNFRIRTIKLRGQVSQGICFPLNVLPEGFCIEEGADVTEALGIQKYEPPVPASLVGIMKGPFPSFVPKTDETRVQVMQEALTKYAGQRSYVTEKIDGTSVTYYWKDGQFGVCSRNMDLLFDKENSYWKMAHMLDIETKLKSVGRNIAIQGELSGEGIQGNKLNLKGQTVFFFNLFWIDEYRYAAYDEWKRVFQELELQTVPVLNDDYVLQDDIPVLLKMASVKSFIDKNVLAEGIVIRVKETNELVSFKAINNDFLLKYEE